MNLLQVIEQSITTEGTILPIIEAEIAALEANLPAVAQTKPINFKVGASEYSFVGVLTKIS